jgi:hypothetical protein
MASRGTTFMKQERDRAKKAKAAAKRERQLDRGKESDDAEPTEVGEGAISAEELLTLVAKLQEDLESGRIDLDEFEDRKAELAARIDLS